MNQIVNSDEKGTIDLTETVHELGDDDVVDVTQSPFDLNQEDDDIIQTNEINQDMLHVNQVEKILKEPPHIDQWEDEDEDDDYDGNLSEFSSGKEHSNTEASSETPTIETSPTSFAKKPQLTLDFLDELQDAAPSPFESPLGARYRDSYLNDLRQSITNDQSPSTKRLSPEVSEKFHKDKNNNNNNDAPLKFKKQKKQRKKKFKLEQPAPEEVTNAPDIENLPLCDVLVLFDIDNCSGLFVHLLDQCFDKRLIVFIFGGPALPKVPMNKLNYMAQMIAQQRLFVIMTPKSHKNSADFCLSFYAGICHNKIDSNVPFVIVSSDNAFEETAHQLKVSEPRRQTYIFGAGSHLNVELSLSKETAIRKMPNREG